MGHPVLFTPNLKLLHSTTPTMRAAVCSSLAPVPRQWSHAQYSVSELQPKYVPAAAQSVVELSMGRLSAMIITRWADWLFVIIFVDNRPNFTSTYCVCAHVA